MRRLLIVGAFVAAIVAAGGCKKSGGVGDACTATSDCTEPLVCDPVLDTCQNAGGTDAAGPGTDASGPGTDATGPGTDATGTDATGPGTDASEPPGTDASSASMVCIDWCTCQTTTCSTDESNIYTGGSAMSDCLSDCAGLAGTAQTCRETHCGFAEMYLAAGDMVEWDSHCNHSAGLAVCM